MDEIIEKIYNKYLQFIVFNFHYVEKCLKRIGKLKSDLINLLCESEEDVKVINDSLDKLEEILKIYVYNTIRYIVDKKEYYT